MATHLRDDKCLQGAECGLPRRRVVWIGVVRTLERACFRWPFSLDGREPKMAGKKVVH